jgi:hypothetical protein
VYRALIRSILDYACIAFDSASISNLKLLDTVQYKALLLVTGALKGTPLSSLLAECGEMSLQARRTILIRNYLLKLDKSSNNPARVILSDIKYPALGNKYISVYSKLLNGFIMITMYVVRWL